MLFRLLAVLLTCPALAAGLPGFDLSSPAGAEGWLALHDVQLGHTNAALTVRITGDDPYFLSPARDFETNTPLWLNLHCRSESGGPAQIFWSGPLPLSEERSIRFFIPPATQAVVRIPIPSLGPGTRLRIDPPGTRGRFELQKIAFEPRPVIVAPIWSRAEPPEMKGPTGTLTAGSLTLKHASAGPGTFTLSIQGQPFAIGHTHAPIGYLLNGRTRWFDTGNPMAPGPRFQRNPRSLSLESRHQDLDGAIWTFRQEFRIDGEVLRYRSRVTVDQDRSVLMFPALVVLPGAGTFGDHKQQGLLAGIEYLEDEDSSSERDLIGAQARRQVPDPAKFTLPLMSIAASNRWLSVSWKPARDLAALHDSPDRITRSGGHLLGLIHPGADPEVREEASLLPYGGLQLPAGTALEAEAVLSAGSGATVVPAVQEFVRRTGLPALPKPIPTAAEYFRLASRGWLDSGIRVGNQYRHAVGNGFGTSPAPDAGFYESWLARRVSDPALAERLRTAARENAAAIRSNAWTQGLIGHIPTPAPALAALQGPASVRDAGERARQFLAALGAESTIAYHAPSQGKDLGRTHWANTANGLNAAHLSQAFDLALLSGDAGLVDECLVHLRRFSRHDGEVPRGAQTWEVPLHTPDILASAYLTRIHVIGYELTRDRMLLERARYWAWTGVPFVYLHSPVAGPVATYSTTPVLGATQFIAPNWIGLPVQWCGLVYADALLRLAAHDRSANWTRLAHGIGFAGVQHVHPESDGPAMGCLPDSFDLRSQSRNPVPINPGTLLPIAAEAYGQKPLQGLAASAKPRLWVLAAGSVERLFEEPQRVRFRVQLPADESSHVILGGVPSEAVFRWKGQPIDREPDPGAPASRAILRLDGDGDLEIRFP